MSCGGGYNLGGRRFGCLGVHGPMNLHRAIARSCNTYFYTMGRRIGIERFADDVRGGSASASASTCRSSRKAFGTIPDSAWKLRRHRQEWSQADTLNAAIGQGYVILNPLQLAVMASRIASGRDIQPRLILNPARPTRPCPSPPRISRRCARAWTRW